MSEMQQPQKKKHTVRNVLLIIFGLMAVGIVGCVALIGGVANEASKSIEENANKPGGDSNPMAIVEGKAFEVDGLNYAGGWSIKDDGMGSVTVEGLKVTNNRDAKDSALVEIKLWDGKEVLASIDCTTDPIGVGTTVTASCLGTDEKPGAWDRVTINDSF